MSSLTEDESAEVLKGTALEIYRLLLKSSRPLGTREIQRALKLSSPSVAEYNLSKLEHVKLVKKESGKYIVDKLVLQSYIKISRFLIPRYLFYLTFAIVFFSIELIFLRPVPIDEEYFFYTTITLIFAIIFAYETVRVWLKGSL